MIKEQKSQIKCALCGKTLLGKEQELSCQKVLVQMLIPL